MSDTAQTKTGRALIAILTPTPLGIDDRLYASPEFLHEQVARIEAEAVETALERLRQVAEPWFENYGDLNDEYGPSQLNHGHDEYDQRAAVMRVIAELIGE